MIVHLSRWAVLGSIFCLSSLSSASSVTDTYGISARSIALGNAPMSGKEDAYQAFTNPAALVDAERPLLAVDYIMTSLRLNDLNDPEGVSPSGLPLDPYRASRADNLTGASLGINLPLTDSIHFGLAAYMPSGNFGRLWGGTARDLSYLRYSERQQRPAIYTALALRLPAGWSIGAGAYYTLRARGILQMALGQDDSAARFDLEMEPVLIPYGGVQWTLPMAESQLKIGFVYRAEQDEVSSIDTDLAINFDTASLPFSLQTNLAPFYDPEIFRLGAGWETGAITLYGSAELSRWSGYRPPEVSLRGEDIGLLSRAHDDPKLSLSDSWAYRTGLELRTPFNPFFDNLWRLGYERHTRATAADAASSVIDLNRHVIAVGIGLRVLPEVLPDNRSARFELAYQRTLLENEDFDSAGTSGASINAGGTMHTVVGGLHYEL